jgi:hypothetical protein
MHHAGAVVIDIEQSGKAQIGGHFLVLLNEERPVSAHRRGGRTRRGRLLERGMRAKREISLVESRRLAMWHPISTAPYDHDLQLAVIDRDGEHVLVFACRRSGTATWIDALTTRRIGAG